MGMPIEVSVHFRFVIGECLLVACSPAKFLVLTVGTMAPFSEMRTPPKMFVLSRSVIGECSIMARSAVKFLISSLITCMWRVDAKRNSHGISAAYDMRKAKYCRNKK
ncbi:MAG: hypothetical protein LBG13_00155 [Holosporales bacterium]|nr:hypothetical protein [Holosporales bacterium]